ncbi:MAG TPA: hypothetical protein HPP66_06715 [Planctomycetes bacterium]|nr:hypothetical protein [Planctomycetota bacterium]
MFQQRITKIRHLVNAGKTNPIQSQFKPNQTQLKPIKCQNKPNSNPNKPNFRGKKNAADAARVWGGLK